ncbi:MAG: hypothetical protein IT560_10035 [Alphaproteobacteria bacterium]|nr:hypothetical protein [Alphaproteobacteria bacterium]
MTKKIFTSSCKLSILTLVFIAVCSVYTSSQAATESETLEQTGKSFVRAQDTVECQPENLPPWPLENLDAEEREARLNFFLHKYDFKVKVQNTADSTVCKPLFDSLLNGGSLKILNSTSNAPKTVGCKNIQDMTLYRSYDGKVRPSLLPDDQERSTWSVKEKEASADFYYRQTNSRYTEYYDLSKYFGPNSWGVIGESVAIKYNERHAKKMCLRGWDAYIQAGTLGRIINTRSCDAYFLPIWAVGGQRLMGDNESHDSQPSFTAFIELNGAPYALLMAISGVWNNFSYISSPRGAMPQVILTPLLNPNDVKIPVAATSSCLYEVTNAK